MHYFVDGYLGLTVGKRESSIKIIVLLVACTESHLKQVCLWENCACIISARLKLHLKEAILTQGKGSLEETHFSETHV